MVHVGYRVLQLGDAHMNCSSVFTYRGDPAGTRSTARYLGGDARGS